MNAIIDRNRRAVYHALSSVFYDQALILSALDIWDKQFVDQRGFRVNLYVNAVAQDIVLDDAKVRALASALYAAMTTPEKNLPHLPASVRSRYTELAAPQSASPAQVATQPAPLPPPASIQTPTSQPLRAQPLDTVSAPAATPAPALAPTLAPAPAPAPTSAPPPPPAPAPAPASAPPRAPPPPPADVSMQTGVVNPRLAVFTALLAAMIDGAVRAQKFDDFMEALESQSPALVAATLQARSAWIKGGLTKLRQFVNLVKESERRSVVNDLYVALCDACGPVIADRILAAAVQTTEQSPEARFSSPREFL